MSGPVLNREILEIAFSEVDILRGAMPEAVLTVLAQEVVQRVSMNLRGGTNVAPLPSSRDLDALCDALLSEDALMSVAFIEQAMADGADFETICQSYLTAAASRLGEWWDEDQISFYQVTIGAGRIYAILRILRLERVAVTPDLGRTAIFASVPGENHTLGITIAADLLREQGWDIELLVGMSHDDLVRAIELRQVPVIGLSASGKRALPALIRLIFALRISNPAAKILVCGQIGALEYNLVGITGADAVAEDFPSAALQMERLNQHEGYRPL